MLELRHSRDQPVVHDGRCGWQYRVHRMLHLLQTVRNQASASVRGGKDAKSSAAEWHKRVEMRELRNHRDWGPEGRSMRSLPLVSPQARLRASEGVRGQARHEEEEAPHVL